MKNLKNHVQLIGHLGKDLELKETSNGNKFARVSIATNEAYYKKNGEKVENTDWHNCIAWGNVAEQMSQYCKKGQQVALQGKLSNRSYEDKSGETQYITEVQVKEFLLF